VIEAAISNVNAYPRILNGTKLKIKLYILNKIEYQLLIDFLKLYNR
jgi:hypothetical protein